MPKLLGSIRQIEFEMAIVRANISINMCYSRFGAHRGYPHFDSFELIPTIWTTKVSGRNLPSDSVSLQVCVLAGSEVRNTDFCGVIIRLPNLRWTTRFEVWVSVHGSFVY